MRRLSVLLLLLAAACVPVSPPTDEKGLTYTGLGLEALDAYHATFELRFSGTYDWVYRLETRSDGTAVEHDLHLEGVNAGVNPGDVRVVIEGNVARMRGPGTGDVCIQFPVDLDLAPSFLTPDDLVSPEAFQAPLAPAGTETVAGSEATHYTSGRLSLGDWSSLEADLWRDDAAGVILRYDLQAIGTDPLFDAGEGDLSGRFLIEEIGPQTIEPVMGCEIDLPLPPDATRLVRLPGLVVFESGASPDGIVAFYQAVLVEEGWQPAGEPRTREGVIQLTYTRGGQELGVNVEASGEGAHVELLLDE